MTADDFPAFFRAVHGVDPFPWQHKLAHRVVATARWPRVLGLPTAAGKTAAMDIAVFALACAAGGGPSRTTPRRIFFVIDRRVVVDQAFERACRVADRSKAAVSDRGILRDVAGRLLTLGGIVPLQVAELRGGLYRDETWTRSPAQPALCVSTVDQIGSRLLFRGYGLSQRTRNPLSIHAGLVGHDALIFLDEAHLSRPFEETLAALARYREWAETPLATPWQIVRLSATPRPGDTHVFRETDQDRADSVLGPRLRARKLASLVEVRVPGTRKDDPPAARRAVEAANRAVFVERLCGEALALHQTDPEARVFGLVVNRVGTARAVFERLRAQPDQDAILLTGRTRPYERDQLLTRWLPRLRAGRPREPASPLFVVATQCIEVGADLDFDALVTEGAALDALRQRFGRLDRLGQRGESRAAILVRSDQVGRAEPDEVYGSALATTWRWLEAQARRRRRPTRRPRGEASGAPPGIDMGVRALTDALAAERDLDGLWSPTRVTPVLLPAHLDLWVQTSPVPVPDPDVALFLHGRESAPADVQVVWRADLDPEHPESWAEIVSFVPPVSAEAMPVPPSAVRAWLTGATPGDMPDLEGTPGSDEAGGGGDRRPVLRWQGLDEAGTQVIAPKFVRPGDTIVVPASYGGADAFGWCPEASAPVRDLADEVSWAVRSLPLLRVHPALLSSWLADGTPEPPAALAAITTALADVLAAAERDEGTAQRAQDLLAVVTAGASLLPWVRESARSLMADGRRRALLYHDGRGIVLIGRRGHRVGRQDAGVAPEEFTDTDDASWMTRPVSLRAHSEGVQRWALRFAQACGVAGDLAADLGLAAWLHDVGKADPRFQVMLHRGDEAAMILAEEPLAKSGMDPRDRTALRRTREQSGYPAGYVHESASVALVTSNDAVARAAHDPELVLHLVASHHGCARPFLPAVRDREPQEILLQHGDDAMKARSDHGLDRLDSGVSDRFWRLVRRYGWYGLAYLEAILRLADHSQSEEEQTGE